MEEKVKEGYDKMEMGKRRRKNVKEVRNADVERENGISGIK